MAIISYLIKAKGSKLKYLEEICEDSEYDRSDYTLLRAKTPIDKKDNKYSVMKSLITEERASENCLAKLKKKITSYDKKN